MKKMYKTLSLHASSLLVVCGLAVGTIQAQMPEYYNLNTSTTSINSFPLNSTSSNRVQWIYGPNLFWSSGTGNGTPAFAGAITHVYFRRSGQAATTYSDFTVSLGQNSGTATNLTSGAWLALTQCFYAASYTTPGATNQGWLVVELQQPFIYNPNLSLVVELKVSAGTGNTMAQNSAGGNTRLYGAYGGATGTASTGLVDLGIDVASMATNNAGIADVLSPQEGMCADSVAVEVVVGNYGINQVNGVTIEWEVNGVAQTPFTYTGTLDTINGSGSTIDTVTLGNYYFEDNTDFRVWTTLPNNQPDTVNENDTASRSWFASNPQVDIDDVTICSGGFKILNTGEWESVIWSTGSTSEGIVVAEAGIYGVTVTDEYNCTASDQVLVTVAETPAPEFGAEVSGCGLVLLNAGNTGATYAWSTGETAQTIAVEQSGGYVVTITTTGGCMGVGKTFVTINTPPDARLGENFSLCTDYPSIRTLNLAAPNNVFYLWSTGDTTENITINGAGKTSGSKHQYSVTVEDVNGCVSADTVEVRFEICTPEGIAEGEANDIIRIYPNPAHEILTIDLTNSTGASSVELADLAGRVLRKESYADGSLATMNLKGIAPGQYLVTVQANNAVYVKPIIIQ